MIFEREREREPEPDQWPPYCIFTKPYLIRILYLLLVFFSFFFQCTYMTMRRAMHTHITNNKFSDNFYRTVYIWFIFCLFTNKKAFIYSFTKKKNKQFLVFLSSFGIVVVAAASFLFHFYRARTFIFKLTTMTKYDRSKTVIICCICTKPIKYGKNPKIIHCRFWINCIHKVTVTAE